MYQNLTYVPLGGKFLKTCIKNLTYVPIDGNFFKDVDHRCSPFLSPFDRLVSSGFVLRSVLLLLNPVYTTSVIQHVPQSYLLSHCHCLINLFHLVLFGCRPVSCSFEFQNSTVHDPTRTTIPSTLPLCHHLVSSSFTWFRIMTCSFHPISIDYDRLAST
jgi:hypothetical protein